MIIYEGLRKPGYTRFREDGVSMNDKKLNCWEHKACGREPNGVHCADLGICPASTDEAHDGVNGGVNGGRVCWAIVGTLCGGEVQGTMARKLGNCLQCEFFKMVSRDEADFVFKPD